MLQWLSELFSHTSLDFFSQFGDDYRRCSRRRRRRSNSSLLQVHEGSALSLSITFLPQQASLFASQTSCPILLGWYHWTNEWLLCRIFSHDFNGTYTVVWQDGFLQVGTSVRHLRIPSPALARRIAWKLDSNERCINNTSIDESESSFSSTDDSAVPQNVLEPMTINGLDVWEAAKQGDIETALAIIDGGGATPNDVELLDATSHTHGRTPLYWACFGGHVELVRELLLRGGVDHDGAAYCAVTTRQAANDNQDILFDPDTGVYSDFVDYDPAHTATDHKSNDDVLLIRAMLVAVKSAQSTNSTSLGRRLLKQLYHEASKECVICLVSTANAVPVPCGHVACCVSCLNQVRKRRDGCPLCRAAILAVVPTEPMSGVSSSSTK